MLLPLPEQNLPAPGRVLASGVRSFPPGVFTQISIAQGLKGSDGKNFLWSTDVNVELPIRLVDDGEFGAYAPITVVEAFANVVRQYPDNPAVAWKSVRVVSHPEAISDLAPASSEEAAAVSTAEPDTTRGFGVVRGGGENVDKNRNLSEASHERVAVNGKTADGEKIKTKEAEDAAEPRPVEVVAVEDRWYTMTWQAYWDDVCLFAKALLSVGVESRDRVAVMGYNAPEWAVTHFGTIFCNAVAASIYATNNVESTSYVLGHCACKVAVCDTLENLEKFLAAKRSGSCPDLKIIVVYGEALSEHSKSCADVRVVAWDTFMGLGRDVSELRLSERMETQRPGMCCELVYTSGTTGIPKGVMLSHDNMTWITRVVQKTLNFTVRDSIVSFLPLSHIAPQMIDLFLPVTCGLTTYFAQPDALRGSLLKTLQEVRPTYFFAVPRVWEKVEDRIRQKTSALTGLKRKLFSFARGVGYEGTLGALNGRHPPVLFGLAKSLVLNKIKVELGLDRCKAFGTGAAPIPRVTQDFFMSLGIPICDIFGMSESSGPQNCNFPYPHWFKLQSCGVPCPATEVRIADPDQSGVGEFCFRGRNVFMGYYNDEKATRDTIDTFGFLHSGDLGYIDDNGFLFITGRLKELLVTAGGENVPPVAIEAVVKEEMTFVSNCQVVGDRRKFLTLLICLKSVPDKDGQPTTNLPADTVRLFSKNGSQIRTSTDAALDPGVRSIIENCLQKVNSRAISRAQRVQDWRIIPNDFTIAGGELTATMKLRRNHVIKKYSCVIDDMYEEAIEAARRASDEVEGRRRSRL